MRIVHSLDTRTRTSDRDEIANTGNLPLSGMYARVELVIDHHPARASRPRRGHRQRGRDACRVRGRRGRRESPARTIATGVGEGTLVEVTKGLTGTSGSSSRARSWSGTARRSAPT
jgi:hypothetical protein